MSTDPTPTSETTREVATDGAASVEVGTEKAPRLSLRGTLVLGAAAVVFVAGVSGVAYLWWDAGEFGSFMLMALILYLVMFALMYLLSPQDQAALHRGMVLLETAFAHGMYWYALFAIPLLASAVALKTKDVGNDAVRVTLELASLGVLIALLCIRLSRTALRTLRASGRFILIWVYAGTVVLLAPQVFANLTWELHQVSWIELDRAPPSGEKNPAQWKRAHPPSHDDVSELYYFQLAAAVPGGVPEKMLWKKPVVYDQQRVGALLVLFTLVIVGPIIAFIIAGVKRRQGPTGQRAEDESADPGPDDGAEPRDAPAGEVGS